MSLASLRGLSGLIWFRVSLEVFYCYQAACGGVVQLWTDLYRVTMFHRYWLSRGWSRVNIVVQRSGETCPALCNYHRIYMRTLFVFRRKAPKHEPASRVCGPNVSATASNSSSTSGHDSAFREAEMRIVRSAAETVIQQLKDDGFNSGNRSSSFFFLVIICAACGLTVLYVENLRSSVIETSGNVAGSLLHSNAFRELAMRFLNDIAEEFLNSPEMHEMLQRKAHQLLLDSEHVFRDMIIRTLRSEEVANASFKFSQSIADRLCQDPEIIEMVGQLLLDAINTETSVNGAAEWFAELTKRDDTRDAVMLLLSNRILSDAKLQVDALNFCKTVTTQFLNDKDTRQESANFLKALLNRPSVQAQLSQTLVDVVKHSIYPRWLNNPDGQGLQRFQHQKHGAGEPSNAFIPSRFI